MTKLERYASIGIVTLSMIASYMPNVFAVDGENVSNPTEQETSIGDASAGQQTLPATVVDVVEGAKPIGVGTISKDTPKESAEGELTKEGEPKTEEKIEEEKPVEGTATPSDAGKKEEPETETNPPAYEEPEIIKNPEAVTSQEEWTTGVEKHVGSYFGLPNSAYYNGSVQLIQANYDPALIKEGEDFTRTYYQSNDYTSNAPDNTMVAPDGTPGYIYESIMATKDAVDAEGNRILYSSAIIRHILYEQLQYSFDNNFTAGIAIVISGAKDTDGDEISDTNLTDEEIEKNKEEALNNVIESLNRDFSENKFDKYVVVNALYGTEDNPYAADELADNQQHLGYKVVVSKYDDSHLLYNISPAVENYEQDPNAPILTEEEKDKFRETFKAWDTNKVEAALEGDVTYAQAYAKLCLSGSGNGYEWAYNRAGGYIIEYYYDAIVPIGFEVSRINEEPEPEPEPEPDPDPTPIIIPIIPVNPTPEEPVIEDEVIPEGPAIVEVVEESEPEEVIEEEETALADTGTADPSSFFGLGSILMAIGAFVSNKKRKS